MKYFFILFLVVLSQAISAQVIKGGIDPKPQNPKDLPVNKPRTLGGGTLVDKVREVEEKIQRFKAHLHARKIKCLGQRSELKNFSEAIAFLDLQQSTSFHQKSHHGECSHSEVYRCLVNQRTTKLLKSISEHPVLEHYLIEHEDLDEKDFSKLKENLKRHFQP
jgi:pterin-4a-carbinolamine dehydratase